VVDRLLADPTVALNSHSGVHPFVLLYLQIASLILAEGCRLKGDWKPRTLASLDSSSYGSVLSLTISFRLSNITLLNPVSSIFIKLQPKDGGPDD
jgi:hypothetical protein